MLSFSCLSFLLLVAQPESAPILLRDPTDLLVIDRARGTVRALSSGKVATLPGSNGDVRGWIRLGANSFLLCYEPEGDKTTLVDAETKKVRTSFIQGRVRSYLKRADGYVFVSVVKPKNYGDMQEEVVTNLTVQGRLRAAKYAKASISGDILSALSIDSMSYRIESEGHSTLHRIVSSGLSWLQENRDKVVEVLSTTKFFAVRTRAEIAIFSGGRLVKKWRTENVFGPILALSERVVFLRDSGDKLILEEQGINYSGTAVIGPSTRRGVSFFQSENQGFLFIRVNASSWRAQVISVSQGKLLRKSLGEINDLFGPSEITIGVLGDKLYYLSSDLSVKHILLPP